MRSMLYICLFATGFLWWTAAHSVTMQVNGRLREVVEQVGYGTSTLEDADTLAVEGAPWLLASIFPRVIRDRKRDFFGPFQVHASKKRVRFVFLRYQRSGRDNNGPFRVQAGEATTKRSARKQKVVIAWEPPHTVAQSPWCALTSWTTGTKLIYECLEAPREPGGNMQQEMKREFHFSITTRKTKELTFTRACPTAAPGDACGMWTAQKK